MPCRDLARVCLRIQAAPLAANGREQLYSCRAGDFAKFCDRLATEPHLLTARDNEGCSPLHWFALRNHREAVVKLLTLGAPVDAQADNLQTPMMWAAVKVK